MMNRRITALLAAAVMLLSLLSGCGKAPAASEAAAPSVSETEDSPAKPAALDTDIPTEDESAAAPQEGVASEYDWLSYRLVVDYVKVVPGSEIDANPLSTIKDDTFAEIRLLGKDCEILFEDIENEDNLALFVLTDADGNELELHSYTCWGISIDAQTMQFSTNETQEGFSLLFSVPDGTDPEDLTLVVNAPGAGASKKSSSDSALSADFEIDGSIHTVEVAALSHTDDGILVTLVCDLYGAIGMDLEAMVPVVAILSAGGEKYDPIPYSGGSANFSFLFDTDAEPDAIYLMRVSDYQDGNEDAYVRLELDGSDFGESLSAGFTFNDPVEPIAKNG